MRKLIIAIVLGLALLAGCQKKYTTPVKSSPELIAPLGASNISAAGDSLTYELDAPYPARDPVGVIADALRDRGYRPLQRSDYVRGWGELTDQTQHIYQWMGEWRNGGGDLVIYTLQYRYPATESPSLDHLFVSASKKPGAAKQEAEAAAGAPPNTNHR